MSGLADLGGGFLETTLSMIPGFGQVALAAVAVFKVMSKINEAITDTRKELGVSYANAALITAENKVLAQIAAGYGLTTEDISSAQAAIREDLGASVRESIDLSLSFARTAAATGQTSEQLGDTLSLMESISSSSREVLLNQIRTNAAMIEAAGVAPALVMRDLAENAEFEEIAFLLLKGYLPNLNELSDYKSKLKILRDLPQPLKTTLEEIPADSHPMDVMRTGCAMLGCLETEVNFSEEDEKRS